jgi:hypothetical protein
MEPQSALQYFWDSIALKLSAEQLDEFLPLFEQAKRIEQNRLWEAWQSGVSNGLS